MFAKLTFQNKLVLHFTWVLVLIITIASLLFYTYTSNILKNGSLDNLKSLTSKISNQQDILIQQMDYIAVGLIGSKELVSMLYDANYEGPDRDAAMTANQLVFQRKFDELYMTVNTPLSISSRITLFHPEKKFVFALGGFSFDGSYSDKIDRAAGWIPRVTEKGGARTLIPPHPDDWDADGETVFSLSRLVKTTTGTTLGILEVQKPYRALQSITGFDSSARQVYVFDGNGDVFYPYHPSRTIEERATLRDLFLALSPNRPDSGTYRGGDGEDYLYAVERSPYTGLYTVVSRSLDEVRKPVVLIRNITFAVGLAQLALMFVIIYLVSKRLTAPIRRMRASVRQVQLDNLSVGLEALEGNDEIAQLNRAFEKMLQRLKLSLDETLASRLEEAKARLQAYQSQMTPHFLHNTLYTIGIVAEEADQKTISEMCGKLLAMLRYVASFEEGEVTLEEELSYAGHYLSLMKARYEERLQYDLEVTGKAAAVSLPKLTIQPLVENCIQHGFGRAGRSLHVRVRASVENGRWTVQVSDDGCGFEPEALDKVSRALEAVSRSLPGAPPSAAMSLGGMGLINTYSRLRMHHQHRIRMAVANLAEGGACVEIDYSLHPERQGGLST